jgi:hypothetical protein
VAHDLVILGGKHQPGRAQQVVERFDTRVVAGEEESLLDGIVKRQGKHAI